MATSTIDGLHELPCKVKECSLTKIATGKENGGQSKVSETEGVSIAYYQLKFMQLIGPNPTYSLLLSTTETSRNTFFHGACIYLPEHEELYTTSGLLQPATSAQQPVILISKMDITTRHPESDAIQSLSWQKLRSPPSMPMPSGGIAYRDGVLFCSQGSTVPGTGGLFYMPHRRTPEPVVTNFFGRDFNSICNVVEGEHGLWFTDPHNGFEMAIRPRPQLPAHVYLYSPKTGQLRVMADDLERPYAVAISHNQKTMYISDGDPVQIGAAAQRTRPATVYAFDIIERFGGPFLANKRVFAYPLAGIPRGILCNTQYVFVACGDGVEVWNEDGNLLGVIEVPGGVTSICWGKSGPGTAKELFLCSDQRLWCVRFDKYPETQGANSK